MGYFRLLDDVSISGRWHLGELLNEAGEEVDLLSAKPLPEEMELNAVIDVDGRSLDFSLTSFGMPLVVRPVASELKGVVLDAAQFVPVSGLGLDVFAVNALHTIDCLDESESEFLKWRAEDGNPLRVGDYRQVTRLAIDSSAVPRDVSIFRVKGWEVALIINDVVRDTIERYGSFGAKFLPV